MPQSDQRYTALPAIAALFQFSPPVTAAMAGGIPQRLAVPSIHMNGTGAHQLTDGAVNALETLREAIRTVANTGPHARDYYVQSPEAFDVAAAQHRARVVILDAVASELETLALAIADGGFKSA